MATAKKVPAKKVVAKKAPAKKVATKNIPVSQRTIASAKKDEMFAMPQEVKEWIERSSSIMKHQASQIVDLKAELAQLKAYKRFAENRILGTSHE
jgi:uncharacterized protein YecA (UPF0149 family)